MKLPFTKSLRQKNILYVDKNSISFYAKSGQKPIVLTLESEVIKDMEIVSQEKFIQALAFWMDNNKISACDVILVLSENVYFEHAVQSLAGDGSADKEIETFLGAVPLEQMISRVLVDDASKQAIALGRDYYDLLLEFLEKRYIRVLALFPASLLNIKSPEELKVDHLIKNLDDYKKFNFLSDFERHFAPESFIARNSPKNTKNLKIMLGLFGILMIVLVAVIYFGLIRKD
ncbi:hypothetical protein COT50_02555 [candidate division WWE3 bacterium CG08_land_8_20_14_0_20_41_10]|uniref:Uncharacterized protein n=1 Tax=candidate division WWE3 bacterium CG08_land_8_20_14_0_20_41_10 TaxID=1975085 RepID=A0A2H0XBT7_UNCKA|nr:MAG: hypothetical protein COT50_02555 [candidate division WWE3 bacterium CG08_land_8_20_14_0_20_41_10]